MDNGTDRHIPDRMSLTVQRILSLRRPRARLEARVQLPAARRCDLWREPRLRRPGVPRGFPCTEYSGKRKIIHRFYCHEASSGHILRQRAEVRAKESPPMNKITEVLLTVVALAGLYSAIPASTVRPSNSAIRAEQGVLVADGSDPMPLCRAKGCRPTQ